MGRVNATGMRSKQGRRGKREWFRGGQAMPPAYQRAELSQRDNCHLVEPKPGASFWRLDGGEQRG